MKSSDYLEFLGRLPCAITGGYPVHLHHEAVVRKFSGSRKNKFDFGAIPLNPVVHLEERHGWGRRAFWEHYQVDPKELVTKYINQYINADGRDADLAREALDLINGS